MAVEVRALNLGSNAYLIESDDSYVLIDTGVAGKRAALDKFLDGVGCQPGKLRLVVLTHGDFDHADNSVYLREKYGAKIAMHHDDVDMVARGDMSLNRKRQPDLRSPMGHVIEWLGKLMSLRPATFATFRPDLYVDEGYELSACGCEGHVVHLPGHSKGSIGIVTSDGDLFCGDLLYNFFRPGFVMIDDLTAAKASVDKLKLLNIRTVYPGHGKPFAMAQYLKGQR